MRITAPPLPRTQACGLGIAPTRCLPRVSLSLSRERLSRELTMIAKEVKVDQLLWSTYNTLNDVNYDVIQYFTRMHPHIYFTPFRISFVSHEITFKGIFNDSFSS